jgi:23S rRNA (adenine2503-C2)-methyltransferase
MPAIRDYAAATGGRITIAYVAIRGVNTTPAHATQLAALLSGLKVKVNLIDVTDEEGRYEAPDPAELDAFRATLGAALGAPIVRRYSGGKEIGAACGTLAASRAGGELVSIRATDPS